MERVITEDVQINRFDLEKECAEHASLYFYYSEQLVEARKNRDFLKIKYKQKLAEVELEYRTGKRILDCKITESSIASATILDCIAEQEQLHQAETIVNTAQSAEESMRQKKSMLDNLIQLYTMQYYSDPAGNIKSDFANDEQREFLNK